MCCHKVVYRCGDAKSVYVSHAFCTVITHLSKHLDGDTDNGALTVSSEHFLWQEYVSVYQNEMSSMWKR